MCASASLHLLRVLRKLAVSGSAPDAPLFLVPTGPLAQVVCLISDVRTLKMLGWCSAGDISSLPLVEPNAKLSLLLSTATAATAAAALPSRETPAEGVPVDRGVPAQGWRVQDSQCVSGMRCYRRDVLTAQWPPDPQAS